MAGEIVNFGQIQPGIEIAIGELTPATTRTGNGYATQITLPTHGPAIFAGPASCQRQPAPRDS